MAKKILKKTKKAVKKVVKKAAKKTVKKATKKAAPKAAKKAVPKMPAMGKPTGVVTHFYGHLSVAIIKCNQPIKVGDMLHFKGATTDFVQKVDSMQYEHLPVPVSKKGQEIGMKVKDRTREGDEVYPANQ